MWGTGKEVALMLVAGEAEPDGGTVARGPSVKMGYFAQHAMELLDADRNVLEWLEDAFPQAGQAPLRALAGCFGFSGDEIEKKCQSVVSFPDDVTIKVKQDREDKEFIYDQCFSGTSTQDEVFGPGRARLLRAGKIEPKDLVNRTGKLRSLDDLQR